MTESTLSETGRPVPTLSHSALRVATATAVGTTIETYDFVLYSFVAAIVFGPLFFSGADPWVGTVSAIATQAVAFVMRPFGSIAFGRIGDRVGRRPAFFLSLTLMGFASAAVGLLPTHATAGVLAPLLLIALRLIQGFSIGGEWAGSVTVSVEYAPEAKRSFYGSFTQLGNMIGILLSAGTLLLVSSVVGAEAFRDGGWRVPFLCSALLVVVGLVVRSGLGETPEFEAQRPTLETRRVGVFREMIRDSWRSLAGITLLWASPGAALYIVLTGMLAYTASYVPALKPTSVQVGLVISGVVLVAGVFVAARVADRVGRHRMILAAALGTAIWAAPCLLLIDLGVAPWAWVAMAVGSIPYALFSAAAPSLMADLFPPTHRYMGVGLSISLGLVLGGGLLPVGALWWTGRWDGSSTPLILCLVAAGVLTLLGLWIVRPLPLYRTSEESRS